MLLSVAGESAAADWKYHKGAHFVVQYSVDISDAWARETLREAERYYDTIARQIGYTRYRKFWTWEERVKIVIYANHKAYLKATGLPSWSRGGATQYHRQLKSRAIVSFHQEEGFIQKILPHEISHLILADFFGKQRIPGWFNEGVAQFQEEGKVEEARRLMSKVVKAGYFIPMKGLMETDIRFHSNPAYVMIFYAQSVSVTDFLVREYGNRRFKNLCRYMRDGVPFERALTKAYTAIFESVSQLEEKWLYSVRN